MVFSTRIFGRRWVDVTSRDEIGELGRAFNDMADGLVRLEALRRNAVTERSAPAKPGSGG